MGLTHKKTTLKGKKANKNMNTKKRSTSHKYRLFWGFVSSITGVKNWNPKKSHVRQLAK